MFERKGYNVVVPIYFLKTKTEERDSWITYRTIGCDMKKLVSIQTFNVVIQFMYVSKFYYLINTFPEEAVTSRSVPTWVINFISK